MDVVLQLRPPKYGPGRVHPKAASGLGCITVLFGDSGTPGGLTLDVAARCVSERMRLDFWLGPSRVTYGQNFCFSSPRRRDGIRSHHWYYSVQYTSRFGV